MLISHRILRGVVVVVVFIEVVIVVVEEEGEEVVVVVVDSALNQGNGITSIIMYTEFATSRVCRDVQLLPPTADGDPPSIMQKNLLNDCCL